MRKGLFARLAATNIKKNKDTYIPYMFTCMGCIAMYYMMMFLNNSKGMNSIPRSADVKMIMSMGIGVIGIFSFIFLLYSNSFLMKRRQKELGLYNILGMEKGHIGRIMFLEFIYSTAISLAGGLFLGIVGSKLALLLLLKLIHVPAQFGFEIPVGAVVNSIVFFSVVFFLILLNNLRKVHLTRPIELLRGGSVGEKEPKAKWLLSLIGFLCLGGGYYIAVTTESPLQVLPLFFLAVILVMAGTYLLFTTGSIVILKMLRRKKSFYYKASHFTSVSGMIYRMKQNAVGLASICILCTGVLLMISTTIGLNYGLDDAMKTRYPKEIEQRFYGLNREEAEIIQEKMMRKIEDAQIPYENFETEIYLDVSGILDGNEIRIEKADALSALSTAQVGVLTLIPKDEYARIIGETVELNDGEVLLYGKNKETGSQIRINEKYYQVKSQLDKLPIDTSMASIFDKLTLIVTDNDFREIDQLQKEIYEENASKVELLIRTDVKGSNEDEAAYGNQILDLAREVVKSENLEEKTDLYLATRQEASGSFYTLFGGFLFLGIFLGLLFLMGAAMIIYYKQLSEGYEDKDRFEIMQKVGMSHKEVKASIRSQILMVFFAPLLVASLHIGMAFPMVNRLLAMFGISNTMLFIVCTVATIVIFALIYGVIYLLTARKYYKIVERAA